jgi:hypothetical protein
MPHDTQEAKTTRLARRIEIAANIGILAIVGIALILFVLPFIIRGQKPVERAIAVGTRLDLPGITITDARRSVLLILSTECRFCTQSMPFYRRLSSERRHLDFALFAAFPEPPTEAGAYVRASSLNVDGLIRAKPSELHATATPTVVFLDRDRTVLASWVGRLPAKVERAVFEHLKGSSSGGVSARSPACDSADCPD